MPINVQDLINVVAQILEEKNLKAAFKGSLKGGMIAGGTALLGGLLLGPLGLAIGGAIGGSAAAINSKNSFKPVAQIVRQMNYAEKKMLCDRLKHAFRNFGVQDLATVATILLSSTSLQEVAIREVASYLSSEMGIII